jgi:beta-galactosidase
MQIFSGRSKFQTGSLLHRPSFSNEISDHPAKIVDFNRGWSFAKKGEAFSEVDLPHDAMQTEKRDRFCRNGKMTGFFPGGKYIYEKKFQIHEEDLDKYVAIFFEGVYQNCTVFVNGKAAGKHRYGFTEFTIEISDFIKAGENIVSVQVDNSLEPNCRWYTGSGIYRPVSLIVRDRIHISTVRIETKSYAPAVISVSVEATGETPLTVEIHDGENCIQAGKPGDFQIENAKLWGVDQPHLYTCVVRAGADIQQVDFGIRKLEWSSRTGLLLNGKEIKLRGGCIHHDNGVLGACSIPDAEAWRVRLIKAAGYNAIRCAHNPASRALLDACDRQGMLVMDEAFDGWYIPKNYHDYSRWFEQDHMNDLEAMVEKDRNHPSVIMYSIGNEVSETATPRGVDLCGEMAGFVRSLDGTRPVTCGINVLLNVYAGLGFGVYKEKGTYQPEPLPPVKERQKQEPKTGSEFFNALVQKLGPWMLFISKGKKGDRACREAAEKLDILGLNYGASRYDEDIQNYPDRMMVGAESMVADLPYIRERVDKYKSVIGDFAWAAFDYLGEAGAGSWTYHSYAGLPLLAGSGTIDLTGRIGAESHFQRVVWGLEHRPWLGVRPVNHSHETPSRAAWRFTDAIDSWNWQGFEGRKAVVEVYSNSDRIRLELNGKVLGISKIKNYRAIFETVYEPGSLVAIALDAQGKHLSESTLQTGSEKTLLQAFPEKTTLRANGQDLCFIPIEFTDEQGCLKPCIEQRVDVAVEGPVKLAGLGSALYKTDEVFDQAHHDTFQGRALAVLRAGYQPGNAKVTVRAAGYDPVVIPLKVQ